MKDKNWKLRKEALDEVDQIIINSGKRIAPNTGELLPVLKVRARGDCLRRRRHVCGRILTNPSLTLHCAGSLG